MPLNVYITPEQVETRMMAGAHSTLHEVLDVAQGEDVGRNRTLAAAIADASAEIDLHLTARYADPLRPVPPILTAIAFALVKAALLNGSRRELAPDSPEIQERDRAMQTLAKIARGELALTFPKENLHERQVQPQLTTLGGGADSEEQAKFRRMLGKL